MMTPSGWAMASLVVMLWILWSDTLRSKKPHPVLYSIRILLFLGMSGALLLNLYRYPWMYNGTTRAMTIAAVVVGVIGAGYFFKKVLKR